MKYILAVKQNMSQVFTDDAVIPVTVLSTGDAVVTQVKTKDVDGYEAVQVGFGTRNPKNLSKAVKGHLGDKGSFMHIKEFRGVSGLNAGDKITPDTFKAGDIVTVTATSKGKGFQGVVKRHGFKGGPRSHGQKHSEREPGSISGGLRTGTRKGKRMAGRMGSDTVTVANLKVVEVDTASNTIVLSGAVPGRRGTLVTLKSASK
ncbi:MAG TPA: 50S ribosomal protein L3 [Candidatus Paceibacterota bacterium]|nr:50S ribosomal protein L3 [Candidatus Paceibacterota bacterium]